MKRTTPVNVTLKLLSVVLLVLLAACGSTPTETLSSASSPAEFRFRGMTGNYSFNYMVSPNDYESSTFYDAYITADYIFQGEPSGETIPLVITGPAGWNDDKPYETTIIVTPEMAVFYADLWHLSFSPEIATPPGVYTATTQISGKTYTSTLDVSMSKILPRPVISVTSATADKVDVFWETVPGAKEYYIQLRDDLNTYYDAYTTQTNVSFSDFEIPLDTTKNFTVSVSAMSSMQSTYFPENGDLLPINYNYSHEEVVDIFKDF
jgi:hypothetical protein